MGNTIYIRDVSDETLRQIDELSYKRGMSRNQLCNEILKVYLDCQREGMHKMLPDVVQSVLRSEIKDMRSEVRSMMNLILICAVRMTKTNEKLNDFLFPQLENLSVDGMDSKQLFAILSSENDFSDDEIEKIIAAL
ncbi:hypothetical protein [Ruminococcus sp. YE78]|nr:hypothetical protein [Ruminococcus sp. YE78]